MEVKEAERLAAVLAKEITALLQVYETATGCLVHSVPVQRDGVPQVVARVKIQLP